MNLPDWWSSRKGKYLYWEVIIRLSWTADWFGRSVNWSSFEDLNCHLLIGFADKTGLVTWTKESSTGWAVLEQPSRAYTTNSKFSDCRASWGLESSEQSFGFINEPLGEAALPSLALCREQSVTDLTTAAKSYLSSSGVEVDWFAARIPTSCPANLNSSNISCAWVDPCD